MNKISDPDILSKDLIIEYCEVGIENPQFLHIDIILDLLGYWREILTKQRMLVDLKDEKTLVIGDIHGDFEQLKRVFNYFDNNKDIRQIIINGDIIDRGDKMLECIFMVIIRQIKNPDTVFVTRGNHEDKSINEFYGFKSKCMQYYNQEVFDEFNLSFEQLPYAIKLGDWAFITHGGIPVEPIFFHMMRLLPKPKHPLSTEYGQLLWNDPKEVLNTYSKSKRGEKIYYFGRDLVDNFLELHNLKLIVRSHEAFELGFQWFFDFKLLSIFSSSTGPYEYVNPHIAILDSENVTVMAIKSLEISDE